MLERAIFLDRDNTIIENDGYLGDPSKVKLLPGAATALSALRSLGYRLIVVSNQSGVARGLFDENAVEAVNQEMSRLLQEAGGGGAYIDASYYCPYHPEAPIAEYRADHEWRKPKPGMLKQAAVDFGLDLAQCWMVGDQNRDVGAGVAAGCRTILLRDPDRSGTIETDSSISASPNYVVKTLADAARIVAREGRNSPPAVENVESGAPVAAITSPVESATSPAVVQPASSPAAAPVSEEALADRVVERLSRSLSTMAPSAAGSSPRLERSLDELVVQIRNQNRNAELKDDTSRTDIAAMVLQVLVVIALVIGMYDFFTTPVTFKKNDDYFLAQFSLLTSIIWLLFGVVLQGIVIALVARPRKK